MATINPRKDQEGNIIGYQAIIRKRGFPSQTKTFRTKRDAESWAKVIESEMLRGVWSNRSEAERTTVAELLDRYAREVLPNLKGGREEVSRIGTLKKHLGSYTLASLSPSAVAGYRDTRLQEVSSQSVKHELGLLNRALKKGVQEWGIALPAGLPTSLVKMPKQAPPRDRRFQGDEGERLLAACGDSKNPWLLPVVLFAVETSMRAGEILETKGTKGEDGQRPIRTTGLLWKRVDLNKRVAQVPAKEAKNGIARAVPLSSAAVQILRSLPRTLDGKVFGTTYEAIHGAFDRACERAGIEDFRFHDLRHEAASRFFEKGLNPMQAAAVTGHKTLQMLKRYTHLRAEDLARLLDG